MTVVLSMCVAALIFLTVKINATDKQKEPTTKPVEWKLPKGTMVYPSDEFHVTADASYVFFTGTEWSRQDVEAGRQPKEICWMFETHTGKWTDFAGLLANATKGKNFVVSSLRPSPDGKYVLFTARKAEWSVFSPTPDFTDPTTVPSRIDRLTMTAFLVSLEDKKVRRLTEASRIDPPRWFGGRVAFSRVDKRGLFQPICLFDPTGKDKPIQWKVRGMLADANDEMKVILCSCDPDDPGKPSTFVLVDKQIVTMTVQGKVLSRLGRADLVSSMPLLSPKAMYVAFQKSKTRAGFGKLPTGLHVQVMSVNGKEAWKINESAKPITVSDDGKVITIGDTYASDEKDNPIKIWNKQGESRTLVASAQAATVSGNSLFYVTSGNQPLIKSLPLKFME
ncbi:MAG: hypothetical protein SVV80_13480 [Planctomycetota bacterium]|nr:hypothetical protein [Planctomycetota bacterium]